MTGKNFDLKKMRGNENFACGKSYDPKKENEFYACEWIDILNMTPSLCNVAIGKSSGRVALLSIDPNLIEKEWMRPLRFSRNDWVTLLLHQPQFIEKCDTLDKFDSYSWSCLLSHWPQLAYKCKQWHDFSSDEWITLLNAQIIFKTKAKKYKQAWPALIAIDSVFAENFHHWNVFSTYDWELIIKYQPKFYEIAKLYASGWATILWNDPDAEDECDKWNDFSFDDWFHLLARHPRFLGRCTKLADFSEEEWDHLGLSGGDANKFILLKFAEEHAEKYPNIQSILECGFSECIYLVPRKCFKKCEIRKPEFGKFSFYF